MVSTSASVDLAKEEEDEYFDYLEKDKARRLKNGLDAYEKKGFHHGSPKVMGAGLQGETDTDYFYFLCPDCKNVLRILDYEVTGDKPGNKYNDSFRVKAVRSFLLHFKLYCENCGFFDFVKLSNNGWQGGKPTEGFRKENV